MSTASILPDDGNLPPLDEREWLLAGLRELISEAGHEQFVAAPLLEPSDRCFPDRWEPNARGVRTMARRLLDYAELDLDADISLYDSEHEALAVGADGMPSSSRHRGAAAWFAGIDGYHCLFGASTDGLAEPDRLIGVMAHEVGHAYRRYHQLEHPNRDLEERLTDLTTIYLGFGVLTSNAAYRYRVKGGGFGDTTMSYSHERAGYLSPQAMCFLLAARVVVLRLDRAARRDIKRQLEPSQASFFAAACAVLKADELEEALGLPPRSEWPAPRSAKPRPFPQGDEDELEDDEEDELEDGDDGTRFNADHPVFRVRRTAFRYGTGVGVAAGLAAGAVAALGHFGAVVIAACAIGGPVVGAAWGLRTRADVCSDPDCDARLPVGSETCPHCGGDISGEIANRNERLAAEEELERRAR